MNNKTKQVICKEEGCSTNAYTSGRCNKHYLEKRFAGIECVEDGCGAQAQRVGNRCVRHYTEWLYSEEGRKTKRKKKGKDEIYNRAAHHRVDAARGYARTYFCVDCSNRATSWSLKHDATEFIVDTGSVYKAGSLYSTNIEDYVPRCDSCHFAYDAKHSNKKVWSNETEFKDTFRPETRAKAVEATALVKSGYTTTKAGEALGVSPALITQYFRVIEGMSIREWKRQQKAGEAA